VLNKRSFTAQPANCMKQRPFNSSFVSHWRYFPKLTTVRTRQHQHPFARIFPYLSSRLDKTVVCLVWSRISELHLSVRLSCVKYLAADISSRSSLWCPAEDRHQYIGRFYFIFRKSTTSSFGEAFMRWDRHFPNWTGRSKHLKIHGFGRPSLCWL
jgi:hypothetical protein